MKPAKMVRTEEESTGIARSARIESRIEHILATEEELIPSSGFLASVMERVQEEAAAPEPIPFPWARAVPGILLLAGVFGWCGFELVHLGLPALGSPTLSSLTYIARHLSPAVAGSIESAGLVVVALSASLFSWLLSRRLAGRGGLL